MRFSNYNILSEQLNNGEYLLLNGLTGTLDLIDEEAYALITANSKENILPAAVINQLAGVCEHFVERGYLTELSADEELLKAETLAFDLLEKQEQEKWTVVILPSLECNYRCTYCFEQNTGYPAQTMSKKQADAIFEIIKGKTASGARITLYGGEPLAKKNREIIEYIVEKGKELGCHFFAVTNGHDLDHYIDLLGEDGIRGVQISMDGPRDIHNRRRISLDNVSSYDKILANIEKVLQDTTAAVYLRINLDKRNAPYAMDFLEDLEKRGLLDNPAVNVAANQVTGIGDLTLINDEMRVLEKTAGAKYPRLKEMFSGRSQAGNDSFFPALYVGEPVVRRVSFCGASGNMKLFCPDGKIYACWAGLGRSDQVIGTFDEAGHIDWNTETLEAWKRTTLPYNRECLRCKFAFLCAGGCRKPVLPKETAAANDECDYYKHTFESYLAGIANEYLAVGNE